MWDELYLSDLLPWGCLAIVGGSGLGFLPRSQVREYLLCASCLLPIVFVFYVGSFLQVGDFLLAIPFFVMLLVLLIPLWGGLALLGFNIVRKVLDWKAG